MYNIFSSWYLEYNFFKMYNILARSCESEKCLVQNTCVRNEFLNDGVFDINLREECNKRIEEINLQN